MSYCYCALKSNQVIPICVIDYVAVKGSRRSDSGTAIQQMIAIQIGGATTVDLYSVQY